MKSGQRRELKWSSVGKNVKKEKRNESYGICILLWIM